MSVNTERPGIYTAYRISQILNSNSGSSGIVAAAAAADSGEVMKVYTITSYSDAAAKFGASSQMAELIKILILNGAPSVRAVPVHIGEGATAEEYKAAFELISKTQDVRVVICDSLDSQVHSLMMESIMSGQEKYGFRLGVVEASGEDEDIIDEAKNLNCERMILVREIDGSKTKCAAAAAAVIAAQTDPAVPLNGAELKGITAEDEALTDARVTELIRGGVMPVEANGSNPVIVRGITTRTMTDSSQDYTFREINTVLIADNVITSVKNSLKAMFYRAKNNAQTRGAIRTQVIVELEKKIDAEIIDDYGNVSAVQNLEDPTVCDVSFDFTITHGLNRINLTAYITV